MRIHPKVSGSALGAALGTIIDGVLSSIHGLHLAGSVYGAIPSFLSLLGGYLAPDTEVTPVTRNQGPPSSGL